jgi:hypothetical protein
MLFSFFDSRTEFFYFGRNELTGLFENFAKFPRQFLLIDGEEGYRDSF